MTKATDESIRRAAVETQRLLDNLYAAGEPPNGSALDQAGLRDGLAIVDDYLAQGEAGLAFEHLLYMVSEPALRLSAASRTDISKAAIALGMFNELAKRLPD